jgi:hypothetical protein
MSTANVSAYACSPVPNAPPSAIGTIASGGYSNAQSRYGHRPSWTRPVIDR